VRGINNVVPFMAAAFALCGAAAAMAFLVGGSATERVPSTGGSRPVWTEVQWPFPTDPWGKGKAFRCKAADCGSEVHLYLRAKLGFCNCTTGIADDADLDRMGDLDLIGADVSALGAGRAITVGPMQGRSRAYALTARDRRSKTVISIAFNERCDMIAATALLQDGRPATIEPAIIEFLNSRTVLHWSEVTLGL
jgi:hypothetical protein